MGWREWFGFSKPRDAPDTELPKIEDNVRDSGGIFVFGQTLSGERVDEKSALQIATVYACVRLLAETDLPIQTIAEQIGYEDPLAFSKAFKKVYEQSPTAYRKQVQDHTNDANPTFNDKEVTSNGH